MFSPLLIHVLGAYCNKVVMLNMYEDTVGNMPATSVEGESSAGARWDFTVQVCFPEPLQYSGRACFKQGAGRGSASIVFGP